MNEKLYEYLCNSNLLLHGIGEIDDEETYYKFSSIINNGGLFSKNRLKNRGIDVEGRVTSDIRIASCDVISLFDPSIPEIKRRLLSEHYFYFFPFHPNVIFFIINKSNLNLVQNENSSIEINEIDGFIPIQNFEGIIAPFQVCEKLEEVLNQKNINLPIYDFDFNCINNVTKRI